MLERKVAIHRVALADPGAKQFRKADHIAHGAAACDFMAHVDIRALCLQQGLRGRLDQLGPGRQVHVNPEQFLRVHRLLQLGRTQNVVRYAQMYRTAGRSSRHLDRPAGKFAEPLGSVDLPAPLGELLQRLQPVVHLLELVTPHEAGLLSVRNRHDRRAVLPGVIQIVHRRGNRNAGNQQRRRLAAGQLVAVGHCRGLAFLQRQHELQTWP